MRTMRGKALLTTGLGLLLAAGLAFAAVQEDPVALLVRFQGDVQVAKNGGGEPLWGSVGMHLHAGDRVLVAQGGEAVVLYRTGRLVKASAPVTIERVEGGESSSLFANTVRTLGQVATTDAQRQPNRQGMIRPIAGAPVPVAPRNGITVLDMRPTFTWLSAPVTGGYIVQIQRQGPDSPRPVRFDVGKDTTWTWPLTEAPLVPGAAYVWTVGGVGIGRVAEPQMFRVAGAQDLAGIEETMNSLIQVGIDPSTDGLFLTALAYRDAGMFYEAHRALDRIERMGNGNGRAFFMLRGEMFDAVGDVARAEAAFAQADRTPAS